MSQKCDSVQSLIGGSTSIRSPQAMASIDRLVQTWMASGRDEEIVETVSGTLNTTYGQSRIEFDNTRYLE